MILILPIFIGFIVILIGIFLLYIAVFGNREYIEKRKRCTAITEGTFITFVEKELPETHFDQTYYVKYYFPVFEYFVDENRYEVQSNFGETKAEESFINQKKKICYNPNKYEESYVSGENLNKAYCVIKIASVIFLGAGIIDIILFFIIRMFY